MIDSKLAESIRALSVSERGEFASFLDSRFFQREFSIQQLKQLLELILAALKNVDEAQLSKNTVHALLFPAKPYTEARVDRLMFELNRLVKTYLLVKNYLREENEVRQTLDWSALQRKRGADPSIEKTLQRMMEVQRQKKSSADGYFAQYQIALERHEWYSTFNKAKGDLGIPQAIEPLGLFYHLQRLELYNRFLLQCRISSVEAPEEIRILFEAEPVPEHFLGQSPTLHITYKINRLLQNTQPDIFGVRELMDLIAQFESSLQQDMLAQFYAYLRNFCAFLFDAGRAEFGNILHEMQRDNLTRGYYYYEGKIHPNSFLNITQHAIRENNLQWAREFVTSHKDKIVGEGEAREFFRMNEALCLFAEGDYESALATIPFGSTYSAYHLMARRLELKIYYELNSPILPNKIDAFKMYINRSGNKTLSKNMFDLMTSFGNFVHQLSSSIPGDKKRSEQLQRRIQEKKLVGERSWLLEKAKALAGVKR